MPPHRSPKWRDVTTEAREGHNNPKVTCNYCSESWFNTSVQRIDVHMKRCKRLPTALYMRYERDDEIAASSVASGAQRGRSQLLREYTISVADKDACDLLLAEAVYSSGVPFAFVCYLPYALIFKLLLTFYYRLKTQLL